MKRIVVGLALIDLVMVAALVGLVFALYAN
ncbi:MAG: hypothetical protein V7637_6192 [Mycobacteriales bacterium]|jgi:hypothetical protein